MQMYQVDVTANYPGHGESAKVLVCAPDGNQAAVLACAAIGVAPSQADFDVRRIKPSAYILEHKEWVPDESALPAFITGGVTMRKEVLPRETPVRRRVTAEGWVFARTENAAVLKLSKALKDSTACRNPDQDVVKDLSILVVDEPTPEHRSRVPQNAIYTHTRVYAGGAASP